MKYIALLRGINISGKNKIPMAELKVELEKLGYHHVITYLNSGNVIFEADSIDQKELVRCIYNQIKETFQLEIPVYVIEATELKDLWAHKPSWWGTDHKELYDNLIFLIEPFSSKDVITQLGPLNDSLEYAQEYKNKIFWSYQLKDYRKSFWWSKSASPEVKDKITIRTANTIKKLVELCDQ